MIDLYYWPTPNGHKITLFLEETGLDYRVRPIDISAGRSVQASLSSFFAQQQDAGDHRQ